MIIHYSNSIVYTLYSLAYKEKKKKEKCLYILMNIYSLKRIWLGVGDVLGCIFMMGCSTASFYLFFK